MTDPCLATQNQAVPDYDTLKDSRKLKIKGSLAACGIFADLYIGAWFLTIIIYNGINISRAEDAFSSITFPLFGFFLELLALGTITNTDFFVKHCYILAIPIGRGCFYVFITAI
jgi:hypothetical protein